MIRLTRGQPRFPVLAVAAVWFVAAVTVPLASAATITWGSTQNISGDSNVTTSGTLLYAYNVGTFSVSTTVNGVVFAPFALPATTSAGTPITIGSVSISESTDLLFGDFNYGSASAPFSGLTTAYQDLLKSGATASAPGTITLQLDGLTVGQEYDFQWWSNNSSVSGDYVGTIASATNSVTLTANTYDVGFGYAGGTGQYAIGRFTADGTSQFVAFDGIGQPLINGFQVREVSSPSAVPEIDPAGMSSVLALVIGGLSMLERRRLKAA